MASGIDCTDFSTCDEDLTSKKRKLLSIAKAAPMNSKTEGTTNKKGKCYTVGEGTKEKDDSNDKIEESDSAQTSEVCPGQAVDNTRFSVPVKQDYIHVRSRRGQATDSHSLAERVRREKISERMKLLQDLVPGCNKITGKAVMLDEIINYVQSLQHQVEFLSMKLEAVNPRLDFNTEGFLTKDMHEPSSIAFTSNTAIAYPQFPQPEWAHMQLGMSRNIEEPSMGNNRELSLKSMMNGHISPAESCGDPIPQMPNGWDNELQSVVQLGFGQNIQPSFTAQSFQGPFSTSNTNIEH